MLLAAYDVSVLLIGSPDEAALAEGVLALLASADRAASLAGRLPLAHLPALLRRAVLYVGNNSGPKHIAAALGLPTVGIHSGVVDAREWGPRGSDALAIQRRMECSPCYIAALSQCVRDFACMRELMPATVMAACERMLPAGMRRGSPNADCRDHPPQLSGSPWTISR